MNHFYIFTACEVIISLYVLYTVWLCNFSKCSNYGGFSRFCSGIFRRVWRLYELALKQKL
ncbi:TPA: hypothetical protein RTH44_001717 [Campylobacter jejuni]|nr:hypothetical protein [Campylobacter jejuni]HDZ5136017.1 hypothetical protein [Campylobacter jejuni]HDZ5141889.1 hypothetical protein [Campylobacter jejuni]HDZ5142468.1 hypothetical protein [Campylobacter jejuni]